MEETTLKSCPFCGKVGVVVWPDDADAGRDYDELYRSWNADRAELIEARAEVDRLRALLAQSQIGSISRSVGGIDAECACDACRCPSTPDSPTRSL